MLVAPLILLPALITLETMAMPLLLLAVLLVSAVLVVVEVDNIITMTVLLEAQVVGQASLKMPEMVLVALEQVDKDTRVVTIPLEEVVLVLTQAAPVAVEQAP